jgi:hypothetical protein
MLVDYLGVQPFQMILQLLEERLVVVTEVVKMQDEVQTGIIHDLAVVAVVVIMLEVVVMAEMADMEQEVVEVAQEQIIQIKVEMVEMVDLVL